MTENSLNVGVVGAGAWGTALAMVQMQAGHTVTLIARTNDQAALMRKTGNNDTYLPNVSLPENLEIVSDVRAVESSHILIVVVPAQTMGEKLAELASHISRETHIVLCAKGLDQSSGKRLSQIAMELLPNNAIAVLSGPSFAVDVAKGLPTAVTLAAEDLEHALGLSENLSTDRFRCYASNDLIGVELGGALKNVLAIGAGICAGRGYGDSAQAAIITRGFAELRRLGLAAGAQEETLMGLSGFGDLILTCSSNLSRNFAFGHRLGTGQPDQSGKLVEGAKTASVALRRAQSAGIEVPIIETIVRILDDEVGIDEAVTSLLKRQLRPEADRA